MSPSCDLLKLSDIFILNLKKTQVSQNENEFNLNNIVLNKMHQRNPHNSQVRYKLLHQNINNQ